MLLQVVFPRIGDTFGSEIGKRYGKTHISLPLLIRLKGTEGAISLEGTLASLFGSVIMAFVIFKLGIISSNLQFLVVSISDLWLP